MSKRAKAHLAIISANILFGINYSAAKFAMPTYVSPNAFALLRIGSAAFLFWAVFLFVKGEKVDRKDFPRLIFASLFGVVLNQVLFLQGLNHTTPIDSAIIQTANPVLVLVLAAFLLHERITITKLLGIAVGASGAILLIMQRGALSFGNEQMLGNFLSLLNTLSYAAYLVIMRPLMQKYSSITVMKWIFLFGLIPIIPMGFSSVAAISWSTMPVEAWLAIGFVLIGATFFSYLLIARGLKDVKPATVSIYIYSQPLIASLCAIALGQGKLGTAQIISTILVFTGVYLVSRSTDMLKLALLPIVAAWKRRFNSQS
ncbi:DMT family transporter [Williamwhitmania taraxaci]|uniref:EamA domain-containing membrane protein RarD n=1 Tax=Williamwhitmania taraxaci TaxID=1640674 RepID=A0A1G6PT40_9BACT|nr:DMT family transporter [Williamwhitmania taraxaci]SDC82814.1 EamA domain-containing membrane protein RarD [Williamwhitmania taraxaci]